MRNGYGDKIGRLTQRLDHMVPDLRLAPEENQRAAEELGDLSSQLRDLLPDPSLSPDERLERLARVVEGRDPRLEYLESASAKVARLRARLDELLPGDASPSEKISALVAKLDASVVEEAEALTVQQKLEALGDPRTEGVAGP